MAALIPSPRFEEVAFVFSFRADKIYKRFIVPLVEIFSLLDPAKNVRSVGGPKLQNLSVGLRVFSCVSQFLRNPQSFADCPDAPLPFTVHTRAQPS